MSSRPVNNWGSGHLPAPWAVGDTLTIPTYAKARSRMPAEWSERTTFRVCGAHSIDEGDAWYFRVEPIGGDGSMASDRLHVAYGHRSDMGDIDWLEGCTLIKTADTKGLRLREQMLADGWTYEPPAVCETCHQRLPRPRL